MTTSFGCECCEPGKCSVHHPGPRRPLPEIIEALIALTDGMADVVHPAEEAPVAFLIEREGKEMRVCSRCDLIGDFYLARLFDAETDWETLQAYDSRMTYLRALVDDKEWAAWQKQRNARSRRSSAAPTTPQSTPAPTA